MGIIDRLKEIFPKTITGRQGPDVIQIDIPTEIYVKELAIYTATSLIANAISQSEIKVYKSGKSVQDEDYYSLNIKPNKNESASQFWHKVVEKLLRSEDTLRRPRLQTERGLSLADCGLGYIQDYDADQPGRSHLPTAADEQWNSSDRRLQDILSCFR